MRRVLAPLAVAAAAVLASLPLVLRRGGGPEWLVDASGVKPPPPGAYPWDGARGFIRARGARFYFEDGTPFFAIGVNYEGWYDRCWRMWEPGLFDPSLIERDFAKMRWLGVNAVRVFVQMPLAEDILAGRWSKLDELVRLAEKYRVFLLITFWDHPADLRTAVGIAERVAERYADRPIILGYDLRNEPSPDFILRTVAEYRGSTPLLEWQRFLERKYGSVERLDEAWRSVNPAYGLSDEERRLGFRGIGIPSEAWDSPRWADFMEFLNGELEFWIRVQVEAVRRHDPNHLITVGYNDLRLALLPANRLLDFISIHTYYNELSERAQRPSLTVLDLLEGVFPGKPVVYEEFGLSNQVADYGVSAAKEAAVYFYCFFKGFAGAFKWMLNDHVLNPNPYEEKFGVFTYREGREYAKPVAFAIRALASVVSRPVSYTHLRAHETRSLVGSVRCV